MVRVLSVCCAGRGCDIGEGWCVGLWGRWWVGVCAGRYDRLHGVSPGRTDEDLNGSEEGRRVSKPPACEQRNDARLRKPLYMSEEEREVEEEVEEEEEEEEEGELTEERHRRNVSLVDYEVKEVRRVSSGVEAAVGGAKRRADEARPMKGASPAQAHTRTRAHAHTRARAHARTRAHTRTHTRVYLCMSIQANAVTHTDTALCGHNTWLHEWLSVSVNVCTYVCLYSVCTCEGHPWVWYFDGYTDRSLHVLQVWHFPHATERYLTSDLICDSERQLISLYLHFCCISSYICHSISHYYNINNAGAYYSHCSMLMYNLSTFLH